MDDLFHIIDDAQVVLRSKGCFYQKKLYRRGDRLYAGWGSGFVRIGPGDATSHPGVSWESLDLPAQVKLKIKQESGKAPLYRVVEVQQVAA